MFIVDNGGLLLLCSVNSILFPYVYFLLIRIMRSSYSIRYLYAISYFLIK
jgi:hypothetical protein